MTPRLVDIHAHAQFSEFDKDRDAVIRRTLDAGIWMINVGTDRRMSEGAVDLAHKYKAGIFATAGLHPTSADEEFDCDFYKNLAKNPKVVAIGECGLDYYRVAEHETRNLKQKKVFEVQVALAHEFKKPLMIHCREAFADLISILTSHRSQLASPPGVCHFFSGTTKDAKKLMDLGFSFSFGGVITFPPRLAERSRGEAGAREYEKLIKFIPLNLILLETDAPYVAPQAHRGKRNEPLFVEEVAHKIAKVLNKDFEEVAETTAKNAISVFGLK